MTRARAPPPARRARSRPTGSRTSPARPGPGTSATGQYYLHIFSAKQPDLNWENPEVRQAVYAMMRWWLDRGVDGFRMDVINMISKDTSLPDTTPRPGSLYGPGDQHFICGPRNHEFLQEMHREVFAGRPGHVLTVGEMPGRHHRRRRPCSPRRNGASWTWSSSSSTSGSTRARTSSTCCPLTLPDLKASMAAWQAGLAGRGWNSLYFGNHDQPRSLSRFGDDGEHRVASAKTLATVLHLHQGTPYVYQGDELGMANAPFAAITDYRDIQALRFYAEAAARGDTDVDLAALLAGHEPDEPRPGPHPGPVGRLRPTPGSPPAPRGSPSTPTTPTSTRPPRSAATTRCSSTTGSSSPCGTPTRSSPTASSSCCCPSTRRSGPSSRRGRGRRAAGRGQLLGRTGQRRAAA